MGPARLLHAAEYALARGVDLGLRCLPWKAAVGMGGMLGRTAGRLFVRESRTAAENLRRAFPELPEARIRELVREVWSGLGKTAAEFARAAYLSKDELLRIAPLEHVERADRALKMGRGVLLHVGHLGNWEVGGLSLMAQGYPMTVVAKTIKNPYIDRWINRNRSLYGTEVLTHHNPFFPAVKALKRGRILAILMDQNMPTGDVFVPFFGRPAATTTFTALLALKLHVPILPILFHREGFRLVGTFEEPFQVQGPADDKRVRALTARLTRWIEEKARARPAQWLWVHNRWKRESEAQK